MNNLLRLQMLENKLRTLCLSFCCFTYLHISFFMFLEMTGHHVSKPSQVAMILVEIWISVAMGPFFRSAIEDMFEEDYFHNQFFFLIGIAVLYILVQMCIITLFIPSFSKIYVWDCPLWVPIVVSNSYLVCLFYQRYIVGQNISYEL